MEKIYELIENEGRNFGISGEGISRIKKYYENLREWNKKVNLVSRKDFENHFLSLLKTSLWYSNFISPFESFIDVGSGGGFPAIIFKIFNPDSKGILIEPSLKKSLYLNSICEKLGFGKHLEIIRMDFKSAIHFIKKRRLKVDYITTMGFKKKEQIIKEIRITRKGVSFITGEREIERLQKIEYFKRLKWIIESIPEKDFIKGIIIPRVFDTFDSIK